MSAADVEQGVLVGAGPEDVLETRIAALTSAALVYEQPLVSERFQVLPANAISAHTTAGGEHELDTKRPVAVISLTPAGVNIEPVIDRTRVLATFFVALGAGLALLARHR